MRLPPSQRILGVFGLFAVVLSAWLIAMGGPDWPLFFLLIPVLLTAPFYPRGVYLGLLSLSIAASVAVVHTIFNNPAGSYRSIAAVTITMLLACEAIHRMMQGRLQAEQALRASEDRYRKLVDTANEGIALLNGNRRIRYVNARLAELLGHAHDELLNHPLDEFVHEDHREAVQAHLGRASEETVEQLDYRFRTRDGSELWAIANASPFPSEGSEEPGVLVMLTDVTERRRLEQELRHSQKMEALGLLAGGVAHDFNNALTVVIGRTEMLMATPLEESEKAELQIIHSTAHRAASISQRLLTFSRKKLLTPIVFDLNEVVARSETLLRPLVGEDVEFGISPCEAPALVRADPAEIEEVIVNLAVNARDAMPRGGRLTVGTQVVNLEADDVRRPRATRPGEYVILTVNDTGCGMDESMKARVFEPFFTTKRPGEGTGLGLSIVFGVVTREGGHIEVESARDRGSNFKVYLPRVPGSRAEPTLHEPSPIHSGTETILLVEDDAAVRETVVVVLEMSGYKVLPAANAKTAFQICEGHDGPIHLLLTDIILPDIGGQEVAERVSRVRPEAKVLLMTGYPGEALARKGFTTNDALVVYKPFTPSSLVSMVRVALNGRESGGSVGAVDQQPAATSIT